MNIGWYIPITHLAFATSSTEKKVLDYLNKNHNYEIVKISSNSKDLKNEFNPTSHKRKQK